MSGNVPSTVVGNDEKLKIQEELRAFQSSLPVRQEAAKILEAVKSGCKVIILSAQTGSGKTTQIPQILHEDFIKEDQKTTPQIVVTVPRVVAAISAADRVAFEKSTLTDDVSYNLGDRIWYQTGRWSNGSMHSNILYRTDGYELVRRMTGHKWSRVLIIDEVHEWSDPTSTLLALKKSDFLHDKESPEQLIIMSATLDTERIKQHFKKVDSDIPTFDIEGRLFPIVSRQVTDPEMFIPEIVASVLAGNSTLVFVEGKKHIDDTIALLKKNFPKHPIFPFHAELSRIEQDRVLHYDRKTNDNMPAIVVATNMAETSLTIPYMTKVIDNGFKKEASTTRYDINRLSREPISQFSSKQRAGRIGRVASEEPQEYVLVHPTFLDRLEKRDSVSIERWTPDNILLMFHGAGKKLAQYIKDGMFLDAPKKEQMRIAKNHLIGLGAVDEQGHLTSIGHFLRAMPLDVEQARILYEAVELWCVDDTALAVSIMQLKGFMRKNDIWKQIIGKESKTTDLEVYIRFFREITSTEPDDKFILSLLDLKTGWEYIFSRDQYEEACTSHFDGRKRMVYEMFDLEKIGLRTRSITDILALYEDLKYRLGRLSIPISSSEDSSLLTKCLLTGMQRFVFKWDQKKKRFQAVRLNYESNFIGENFLRASVSHFSMSKQGLYVGIPFVHSSNDWKPDTQILFFTTKVPEALEEEILHASDVVQAQVWGNDIHFLRSEEKNFFSWKEIRAILTQLSEEQSEPTKFVDEMTQLLREIGKLWQVSADSVFAKVIARYYVRYNKRIQKFIRDTLNGLSTGEWEVDYHRIGFSQLEKTFSIIAQKFISRNLGIFNKKQPQKLVTTVLYDSFVFEDILYSPDADVQNFLKHPFDKKYQEKVEKACTLWDARNFHSIHSAQSWKAESASLTNKKENIFEQLRGLNKKLERIEGVIPSFYNELESALQDISPSYKALVEGDGKIKNLLVYIKNHLPTLVLAAHKKKERALNKQSSNNGLVDPRKLKNADKIQSQKKLEKFSRFAEGLLKEVSSIELKVQVKNESFKKFLADIRSLGSLLASIGASWDAENIIEVWENISNILNNLPEDILKKESKNLKEEILAHVRQYKRPAEVIQALSQIEKKEEIITFIAETKRKIHIISSEVRHAQDPEALSWSISEIKVISAQVDKKL